MLYDYVWSGCEIVDAEKEVRSFGEELLDY